MTNPATTIRTAYQALGESGAQLHYRIAGDGPAMILLHPSPQDSQALVPAIEAFSTLCTCIAPDTPGYGLSDDIITDQPTMADYARAVFEFADAMGIERFVVYGAATGAQIAIEMGKHQPERLALVMLDANGHIDAPERERIMADYFPEVTPRRDGGHLMTYWDMCANLFLSFPWNSTDPDDRLPLPRPPVEVIHQILLRYLDAGQDYAKAYRVAFEVETIEHFAGSEAPILMNRWEGSPVLGIADDLIAQGLPDNVQVLKSGPTLPERFAGQVVALREVLEKAGLADLAPITRPATPGHYRDYLETGPGVVHLVRNDTGTGSRLVFLHAAGASARRWAGVLKSIDDKRPYVAIDLPGHGHSTAQAENVEAIASVLQSVLASFEGEELHLIGEGVGAAIAAELQSADRSIQLTALMCASVGGKLPDLTPSGSGAHLLNAWEFVRDRKLRSPWDDDSPAAQLAVPGNLSPEVLHNELVDLLRAADAFGQLRPVESAMDWNALREGEGIHVVDPRSDAELASALLA